MGSKYYVQLIVCLGGPRTPTRAILGRVSSPALCTIHQRPGDGGIARVSSMILRVMQDLSGPPPQVVQLFRPNATTASPVDRLKFAARLLVGQASGNFDWLFFDHVGPASIQGLIPGPVRRPYGVFLHSLEVWRELSPLQLRTLNQASVLIANSHFTVERTLEINPGITRRIDVCHLGLRPEEDVLQEPHPSSRAEAGSGSYELGSRGSGADLPVSAPSEPLDENVLNRLGRDYVLIVGRMVAAEGHKGHEQLIGAWPAIQAHVPAAKLVVVGRGDDVPRLKQLATNSGCGDAILFAEWVNDATLDEIYRRAAVFAMPSNGEGFGLVYLEAMKRSLPCIASSTDASREVVVDGTTGFLVDQSNRAQIVDRISRLLQDPDLRARFGAAGYERVHGYFSFGKFRERLLPLLKPLLRP